MDLSSASDRRTAALVAAVWLPLAWCAIAAQLRDDLSPSTSVLVLVLVIVGVATAGDRLAGVIAAVLSGACFDYFLTVPYGDFTIDDANDIEVTILLVLIGVVVTELVLWGRREQARAGSRAGYLDGIVSTSQIVAGGLSSTELSDEVAIHINTLLGTDAVRFVAGHTLDPRRPVMTADGEVVVQGQRIDVEKRGLPTMDETALVATHRGVVHGHFLITASTRVVRPTREQRQVAVLLAAQVAAANAASPA